MSKDLLNVLSANIPHKDKLKIIEKAFRLRKKARMNKQTYINLI